MLRFTWSEFGTRTTDVLAQATTCPINVFVVFVASVLHYRNRERLQQLLNSLVQINNDGAATVKSCVGRTILLRYGTTYVAIATCMPYLWTLVEGLDVMGDSPAGRAALVAYFTAFNGLFLYSPVVMCTEVIVQLVLRTIAGELDRWRLEMRSQDVKFVLRRGVQLHSLVRSADSSLGSLVASDVLFLLATAIPSAFQSVSIPFNLDRHSSWPGAASHCCAYFLVSVHVVERLFCLASEGEEVARATKEARLALEDFSLERFEELSDEELSSVSVLTTMLDSGGTVNPAGYFTLNKRTLVGAAAAIATYMVILLQFKMAEK